MKESSVDFHFVLSNTASLYITIANTGFSSAYTRFDTVLFLTDESTGKSKKIETNIDNRTIAGNDCSTFKTDLDIRSLEKELTPFHCVWKIQYTKNSIHFANQGAENSKTVPVGTLILH